MAQRLMRHRGRFGRAGVQVCAIMRSDRESLGLVLLVCRLGAEAPAKIEGVTLMRPIHSNL